MRTFKVKPEHIKLLKKMYVGWQECEFGAPEIDPKRPYGNSDVLNDIHEIITGKRNELTEKQEEEYGKIHKEMETVLQIFLCNLGIKPVIYESESNYSNDWKKK